MSLPIHYQERNASPNIRKGAFTFKTVTSGNPTNVWGRGAIVSTIRTGAGRYKCKIPGRYQKVLVFPNLNDVTGSVNYHVRSAAGAGNTGNTFEFIIVVTDGTTESDLGGTKEVQVEFAAHAGGDDLQVAG